MEQMTLPNFGEEMMAAWFEPEANLDNITAAQLDEYCGQFAEVDKEITALKTQVKLLEEKQGKMEQKILSYLENTKRTSYDSPVGKITRAERYSVKLPQGEDKKAFFEHLKAKGIFEDVVHMNSMSLNKFWKEEKALAEESGDFNYKMPGVSDPVANVYLQFRKAK